MPNDPAEKDRAITKRTNGFFGPVVCAGVDYITLTCNETRGYHLLAEWGAYRLNEELERGHKLSAWYFRGFDGRSAGSVQMGSDGPTLLIRLSGALAWQHWRHVMKYATNVSRLDVQTTVRLNRVPAKFAEMCEAQALRFEEKHKHGRQVELRRNSKTGKTVYVGSPKSDRFIRIYDKGAESGLDQYRDCWRGEIQFNNSLAKRMAIQLNQWQSQDVFAIATISESMKRVGIRWPAVLAKPVLLSGPARPKSPLDAKLAWLSSQVAPTVHRLLEVYPRSVILASLGLDSDHTQE